MAAVETCVPKQPILRWGMLGHSRFARNCIVPAIGSASGGELTAIASARGHALDATLREFPRAKHFSRYEELIESPDVDAVYLGLTSERHAGWALRALRAGKHVLCEKPLALTATDVETLIAASRAADRRLTEGFMYRYSASTRQLESILRAGTLGTLRSAEIEFTFTLTDPHSTRFDPLLGGGALNDVGCYCINLAGRCADLHLGTEPGGARARVREARSEIRGGVDVATSAVIEFAGGFTVSLRCGFDGPDRQVASLDGADGCTHADRPFHPFTPGTITTRAAGSEQVFTPPADNAYRRQFEHFAAGVLTGAPAAITLAESLRNTGLIDAIRDRAQHPHPLPSSW